MQLILPQSELEQAIKNYVNDLMNVKEGTELCIDLRAGRGIDGFTATVDIIKSGTTLPVKTVVPTPTPIAVPVKITARTSKDAAETPVEDKSEQQEDADSETKEEVTSETSTPVRRPLFGSLKKPE